MGNMAFIGDVLIQRLASWYNDNRMNQGLWHWLDLISVVTIIIILILNIGHVCISTDVTQG